MGPDGLYPSTDAKELKRDMDWLEDACRSLPLITKGNWPIWTRKNVSTL
jgi:hypothetical protein